MAEEEYLFDPEDEDASPKQVDISGHYSSGTRRVIFSSNHPRWRQYKEFREQAKALYHLILKERLGMYLTAEQWVKQKFDVTWVTWRCSEPYPDPALWDPAGKVPLLGNCPSCKAARLVGVSCCRRESARPLRPGTLMDVYYNPVLLAKIFGAEVSLADGPRTGSPVRVGGELVVGYFGDASPPASIVPREIWNIFHCGFDYCPQDLDDDLAPIPSDYETRRCLQREAKRRSLRWIALADRRLGLTPVNAEE